MKLHEIHLRDPFVLPDGDKYYMYGTGKRTYLSNETLLEIYVSTDLVDWTPQTVALEIPAGFWGTENFWAPDVFRHRGRYYMLITLAGAGHKRGTQIFVSDSPTGRFVPLTDKPITPPERQSLDATLYFENGVPYLLYSWEWLEAGSGKLVMVELSDDLTRTVGNESILLSADECGFSTLLHGYYDGHDVDGYVTDAPLVYKTEAGKYLLLWSTFSADGYGIALSECATLNGRYNNSKMLYACDGGHAMLFTAFCGTRYISFHSPNDDVERPRLVPIAEVQDTLQLVS